MNIRITEQITTIRNDNAQCQWTIKTENCFGLIYNSLERHFPNFNEDAIVTNCINYMRNAMTGKDIHPATSYKLLGRVERGHTLLFFREYFDGKESVVFSLQDVDKIRIASRMKSNYLPVSINETTSMEFDDLTNVTQVMVALLYYYSYYGFKLVKCRHCGRWFATKSLKNQYCKQISPCCGDILKGEKKTCEQAVRQITQNCTRLRNAIRTKAGRTTAAQLYASDFLQAFEVENAVLEQTAREAPTVVNLTAYYGFLRQVNKSRGWTGGKSDGEHNEENK